MKMITWNVARHGLAQIGVVLLFAVIDKMPSLDLSWLGPWQGMAAIIVGAIVAMAHEAMGTAPDAATGK